MDQINAIKNKNEENLDTLYSLGIEYNYLPIYTLCPLNFVCNKFFEQLKTPAADSNIYFRVRI